MLKASVWEEYIGPAIERGSAHRPKSDIRLLESFELSRPGGSRVTLVTISLGHGFREGLSSQHLRLGTWDCAGLLN